MNLEVNHPLVASPSRSLVVALQSDRRTALKAARRHSRLVRILKVALPVCALGVIGLYLGASKISLTFGGMEASVARIEVSRERLRMVNPKLEGVNKDKGAYVMTADYAEQDVSKPGMLYLHAVKARTTSADKDWSRMTAPEGTFFTKTEQLQLSGGIDVVSSSGMTAHLETASIDLKTQFIRSQDPVKVEFLNGTIDAQTIEIATDKRIVVFRGRVRTHINKKPDAKQ